MNNDRYLQFLLNKLDHDLYQVEYYYKLTAADKNTFYAGSIQYEQFLRYTFNAMTDIYGLSDLLRQKLLTALGVSIEEVNGKKRKKKKKLNNEIQSKLNDQDKELAKKVSRTFTLSKYITDVRGNWQHKEMPPMNLSAGGENHITFTIYGITYDQLKEMSVNFKETFSTLFNSGILK